MDLHTIGIDLGKTVFHLVGLNLRLRRTLVRFRLGQNHHQDCCRILGA
jgi:hypothetical protein